MANKAEVESKQIGWISLSKAAACGAGVIAASFPATGRPAGIAASP